MLRLVRRPWRAGRVIAALIAASSITLAGTSAAQSAPGTYALAVQSLPPTGLSIGSSTGHNGTTNYTATGLAQGTSVNLQAPATDPAGYTFSQWTLNGAAQTAGLKSITFTPSADTAAVAQYTAITRTLTVQSLPLPGLSIGSSTGHSGVTNYTLTGAAPSVNLVAPATDPTGTYTFSQWTLNGAAQTAGQQSITFTMTADTTAVAQYALAPYMLFVQATPAAGIAIGSSSGHNGTANYAIAGLVQGQSVNLVAPWTDATGSHLFQQWVLNGTPQTAGQNAITFSMTANMTAVAQYTPTGYTLNVQSLPPLGPGIGSSTGHSGVANYAVTGLAPGAAVNLVAPATDPTGLCPFSQWTVNGVAQTAGQQSISFIMIGDTTAVAQYTASNCTLTVQSAPPAALSIGSNTGHNGTTSYTVSGITPATSVNLQAPVSDPSGLYTFSKWSLNGVPQAAGQQSITFSMTAYTTAVATYGSPGGLTVTLGPTAALTAGAQWQVDSGAWQSSGATVSGLAAGNHAVAYQSVAGWTAPAAEQVSIASGLTASITRTYAPQTGGIQVTLGPAGAVTAGAEWNVDGGLWQLSGATVYNLTVGSHTVNYKPTTGWNAPSSESASVAATITTELVRSYVQQTGSVTVTLAPQSAVTAGAQWNVDGGAWQSSGTTLTGLSVGSHTVNFNTVADWNSPSSEQVSVGYLQNTSASGTYALQTGGVQVTLAPAAAVSAGAKWNVDGGAWQSSGATVMGLAVGSPHTINYNSITNWNSPAAASPAVVYNTTTPVTGTYAEQTGSLQVALAPQGAVAAGAQWNVDGGAWQGSGAVVGGLFVGVSHTINYNAVAGWNSPASASATITYNSTTNAVGMYVQQTGSLTVTLAPAAAAAAGAQWNVDGGAWQNSGAIVAGLAVAGSHTINYSSIPNWNPPAAASPTISYNATTAVTGTYVQQTGGVQVTLAPAGAVTVGAKWNVDGGDWQDSGVTLNAVPVGSHTVTYKQVPGWNAPTAAPVAVVNNATTPLTGTYAVQTGGLTITLLPAAAAGAEWNVDGGAWQVSGATVSGLAVGSHAVNYLQLPGWASPSGESVAIANDQTTSLTRTYVTDATPPTVTGLLPAAGAWNVPIGALIALHITDSGSGVDPASIVVSAGVASAGGSPAAYETVYSGATVVAEPGGWSFYDAGGNTVLPGAGYCVGTGADYLIVFQPSMPFEFEDQVYVQVSASDLAGNAMGIPFAYSFSIETRTFGFNQRVDPVAAAGDAFPATATDAAGNVWVAWERTDEATQLGTLWLAERAKGAWTFGSEIQVTTVAQNGDCHKPAIAITPGGTICIAYEAHGATPSVGVVSATTAAPTIWTQVGPVAGAVNALTSGPAIAVDSAGDLSVAGVSLVNGVDQIGVGTLPSGAAVWTVTLITNNAANQISPAIAEDSTGVVYVVWTNTQDNNLYGADSSAAWATINQVTSDGTAGSPAISAEQSGAAPVLHFAWADTGGTPNPDIQYAETTTGWAGVPLTGANVVDEATASNAANPRIAVTGTTGSGAYARVFIVWQDRRSNVPGDTDIMFVERKRDGQFGTNLRVSRILLNPGIVLTSAETNPALGVTADGAPCVAWTDLRENGASHIYFAAAMRPVVFGGPPQNITPAGGSGIFADATNPHFTEVVIAAPANAFATPRNIAVSELLDPVAVCSCGSGLYADGSGLYFDVTGGMDELLGGWVTITVHLTQAQAVTLPSPLTVYRLVPPATVTDDWTWTTDWIQNVSYDPATRVLTFETKHLSSFGVGASPADSSGGGGGGGGCAMSPNGEPDLFILLLPIAALATGAATRLIGKRRSTDT